MTSCVPVLEYPSTFLNSLPYLGMAVKKEIKKYRKEGGGGSLANHSCSLNAAYSSRRQKAGLPFPRSKKQGYRQKSTLHLELGK